MTKSRRWKWGLENKRQLSTKTLLLTVVLPLLNHLKTQTDNEVALSKRNILNHKYIPFVENHAAGYR
jgi:hypothetical protein